ncbi:MAG: multicopper oxidase domain-containing protein [Hamadaea sp.]|nr:multicopper oxidase domain-containing protein [Hamadaea sp.]
MTALSRRALLTAGSLAAAGLAGCDGIIASGGANNSAQGSAGSLLKSKLDLPGRFQVPLPIPPVLKPVRADGTTDYYEITQKVVQAEILPGVSTTVWGYNGIFPGPTVVSRAGRRTVVTHRNELPVPVSVHLHGGKVAPEHDGYPTDLIMGTGPHSGHSGRMTTGPRDYVYGLDQPAATLWYHDHRMDFTGPQVYRGLAGFHLIRDDLEESLGLPDGDRDIPLMITDRAFEADGGFRYPSVDPSLANTPGVTSDYVSGVLGDCILVNGAPWPVLEVAAARYRFRILNASNARRYELSLDEGATFVQIGSDLGLLERPVRRKTIEIAQAERYDVIVDFSGFPPGRQITMRNGHGRGGTADVMRFVVTRTASDDSRIPDKLAAREQLSPDQAVAERQIVFARGGGEKNGMTLWTVNGKPFTEDYIVARPKLGTVEKWTVRALNVEHPFHIHLAGFQILNGAQQGWKDTVNLDNGGKAELLVKFAGYRGKYVLHCHNLEHEDMMMMANFEVV